MRKSIVLVLLYGAAAIFCASTGVHAFQDKAEKRSQDVSSLNTPQAHSAEDSLKAMRDIAGAAMLAQSPCPLANGQGIPAYFHYSEEGALRRAETVALVPGRLEDISAWLLNLNKLPAWAFLTQEGSPNINEVLFEERSGIGQVRIQDEVWKGRLIRVSDGREQGARVELLGGKRLKEAVLELGLLSSPICSEATIVTIRASWLLGRLPRFFSGQYKAMPALFVLRLRDDIITHALREEPDICSKASGIPMEKDNEGHLIVSRDPAILKEKPDADGFLPGDRVLAIKPGAIRVTSQKKLKLEAHFDKVVTKGSTSDREFFSTFLEILDGRHEIRGARVLVDRRGDMLEIGVGLESEDIIYVIDLAVSMRGSQLVLIYGKVAWFTE